MRRSTHEHHHLCATRFLHLLSGELRSVTAWLLMPGLWALLSVGLVLWTLAYRWPYTFQLDFGGDLTTGRRYDDAPYVRTFHDPEPNDRLWWAQWRQIDPAQVYRWTSADSTISLPGIGAGTWLVSITAGGQPTDRPTISRWSDGVTAVDVPITRDPQHDQHIYRLLVRAPGGNLTLHLTTPPFIPPNDPRALGFRAYHATIVPVGAHLPPLEHMALLATAVALLYGTCCRFGTSGRAAVLVGLTMVIVVAFLLVRFRLALTIFTPMLPFLVAACYGLSVVGLRALGHRLLLTRQRTGGARMTQFAQQWGSDPRPVIVALVVFAFALRLGGMLHPHTIFSDIGLHSHNLAAVTQGEIYITEQLPARAGGAFAPYPPGQYLMLAPLQLLFPLAMRGSGCW